jgi:hypothetical protein
MKLNVMIEYTADTAARGESDLRISKGTLESGLVI